MEIEAVLIGNVFAFNILFDISETCFYIINLTLWIFLWFSNDSNQFQFNAVLFSLVSVFRELEK